MNTIEIMHDLSRFVDKKMSYGCYALDELPREKIVRPCLIISNTAPSSHSGKHWVGFYFKAGSNRAEFFDSFGRAPTQKQFKQFLDNNSTSFIINSKRLQSSVSNVCGAYCVVFLYFRSRCASMTKFLKNFNVQTPELNDIKILQMYAKLSEKLLRNKNKFKNQTGGNCNIINCNQTCTPLRKKCK